ncbi:MAG: hypothetical protein RIQ47_238 [Bacteroidota bacterium]|jgi:sugar transferase (PEP-CTERM/EpsH1 system associated)
MKILCITSRVPWPLEKGDKLRIYHQLRELSRHHELILFAVNDAPLHPEALKELKKYCSRVEVHTHSRLQLLMNLLRGWWNGQPFQVAYFTSPSSRRQLAKLIREERPDSLYCQLIRTAEYRNTAPLLPAVLDYMDVFSKGVERRIANVAWYKRWLFRMEWKRLLRYEEKVFSWFNRHTVISAQDRDLLPVADKQAVAVVPNGVDTEYFHPEAGEKSFELLFNGNMNYPPNIESAQFIVNKILPLVHRKHPNVRLLISGASPAPEVLALAGDRVVVSGWVEDVRDSYRKSSILVAPMMISIGLQNKLLEAMAMKLPCVTTALSNNALQAIPGEELLLAGTPEEFADQICFLLEHPDRLAVLAENGWKLITSRFDWASCTARLEVLFHQLR